MFTRNVYLLTGDLFFFPYSWRLKVSLSPSALSPIRSRVTAYCLRHTHRPLCCTVSSECSQGVCAQEHATCVSGSPYVCDNGGHQWPGPTDRSATTLWADKGEWSQSTVCQSKVITTKLLLRNVTAREIEMGWGHAAYLEINQWSSMLVLKKTSSAFQTLISTGHGLFNVANASINAACSCMLVA